MTAPKKVLIYTLKTTHGNYTHVELSVRTAEACDVACDLERCIDNKAGYGTRETAERVASELRSIEARGASTHYDSGYYDAAFKLRYQVYSEDADTGIREYCDPHVEGLGHDLNETLRGMDLLKKVSKNVERARARANSERDGYRASAHPVGSRSVKNLEEVIEALHRLGAIEVAYTRPNGGGVYVVEKSELEPEYSIAE